MIAAIAPFVLLALLALPWALLLRRRFGSVFAFLSVLTGTAILVVGTFAASRLLQLEPVLTMFSSAIAIGIVGFVVFIRRPRARLSLSREGIVRWAASCLGGLVWLVTLIIARVLPGAAPVSWALNGDSANNIHDMRSIFAEHGFLPGGDGAVALQNELQAIAAWIGRPGDGDSGQLLHDMVGLSIFWALAIALTGLVVGLVSSSLVPTGNVIVVGIVAGSGSLLVATWFFTGLPIESGYLNVHVALPFALASWLAFLESKRHPLAASMLGIGVGIVLLTSWSPLVVFPVALVLTTAIRNRAVAQLPEHRRAALVAAVVVSLFAILVIVVYAPSLARSLDSLSSPGHGYPSTWLFLAFSLAVVIVLSVLVRRDSELPLRDGAIALTAAAAGGLAILVAISADSADPLTTYYPTKFSWLATVVAVTIAYSLLVFVLRLAVLRRAVLVPAVAALAVIALGVSTLGPSPARRNFVVHQPLARILSGQVWHTGDAAVDGIARYADSDVPVILWDSGNPDEANINYWLLDFHGASKYGNSTAYGFSIGGYRELRDTGEYRLPSIDTLCIVVEQLNDDVVVVTRDSDLGAQLEKACPAAPIDLVVNPPA